MRHIIHVINAGALKYKNIASVVLLIGIPIFLAGLMTAIYVTQAERLLEIGANGAQKFIGSALSGLNMLFPMFVILIVAYLFNIDHASNAYKKIYALSLSRGAIFFEKLFYALLSVAIMLIIYGILIMLGLFATSLCHPEYIQCSWNAIGLLWKSLSNIYIFSLAMVYIQFFMSMRWSNIFISLGIGMILFLSFFILMSGWKYIAYHPYGFVYLGIPDRSSTAITLNTFIASPLLAVVFHGLSFVINYKRDIL